uniref:Ig-like domain-containing protein n=1 Tax=Biomphalaria glabrata TaxID=6526 RepID=A0A2C9LM94_BIOGL
MSVVTYLCGATLMTFGLCILSCALSQAQTINVTVEEGNYTSFQCNYRYMDTMVWNLTVAGKVLTVATCERGLCNIDDFYSEYISGINTVYLQSSRPAYEMTLQSIYRIFTRVQCYPRADPTYRKTWLLNVIVLPTQPKCEFPSADSFNKDNIYTLTISCVTYVFPTANCSLEVKSNMEIFNTQVTYTHSFSHLTNLYTTTCLYSLSLYATTWDEIDSEFQVTAYPNTYDGKKYRVTTPWLPFFPEAEPTISSFTLNGLSSSITVGCGDKVTVRCKGEGHPGTSIQLYDGSPNVLLENWELPMEIYHMFNVENSCGNRHTLGCKVGSEEQTLILTINSWSKDGSNSSYLIAVVVTLSVAIVITALIVFCYIRMRLRRKRAAMANRRTPHRLYPLDLLGVGDIQPSAPPSYHEIFFIDVTGEPVDLPEYWSLPPPYSEHPDPQLPKATSNEYDNVSPRMTSQEVRSTCTETPPEVTCAALQESRGAPSAAPQVVRGIPSASSQEVRGVPSAPSQEVRCAGSATSQDARSASSARPRDVRGATSAASQVVRGIPSASSQEVRGAGSATSQDARSASSARPRDVRSANSAASQVVRGTPSKTSKEVKDAPNEKSQEVSVAPGETSQELKDASFATSQV